MTCHDLPRKNTTFLTRLLRMRYTFLAWNPGVVGRIINNVERDLFVLIWPLWPKLVRSDCSITNHVCYDVAPGCLFIGYRWESAIQNITRCPCEATRVLFMETTHHALPMFAILPNLVMTPSSGENKQETPKWSWKIITISGSRNAVGACWPIIVDQRPTMHRQAGHEGLSSSCWYRPMTDHCSIAQTCN
jgi:hypothetical protein